MIFTGRTSLFSKMGRTDILIFFQGADGHPQFFFSRGGRTSSFFFFQKWGGRTSSFLGPWVSVHKLLNYLLCNGRSVRHISGAVHSPLRSSGGDVKIELVSLEIKKSSLFFTDPPLLHTVCCLTVCKINFLLTTGRTGCLV